jgi:predicted transcriptional regulator YdeE
MKVFENSQVNFQRVWIIDKKDKRICNENNPNNHNVMQTYSHGAFNVTGVKIHLDYATMNETMPEFWSDFRENGQKLLDTIQGVESKSLHAVYFNLNDTGYDMVVGLWTKNDAIQTNSDLETITIPAQDYMYEEFPFTQPQDVSDAWQKINKLPKTDVNRAMLYDMEMYSEDMKTFTICVGVKN